MPAVAVSHISKSYGTVRVLDDVDFVVEAGEFVTLLGPSGCGKTTTLRCIAGLETPSSGRIHFYNACAFSSEAGINLGPEHRRLGMVFQSYAIWPHMTVAENVAYGLRARRVARAEIDARVAKVLDMVGLPGAGDRNATTLSGGQQQRVALARSLIIEPQVLLLDEPLSNLDARMRERMRFELKDLQRRLGLTAIYVTHDQSEALAMSDRIIVMDGGRIVQSGSSQDIYHDPQSRFVLDFIGQANFLTGTVTHYDAASHTAAVTLPDGSVFRGEVPLAAAAGVRPGELSSIALRPSDIVISRTAPSMAENALYGRIVSQLFLGTSREVMVETGNHKLKVQLPGDAAMSDGQDVWLSVPPHAVRIIP
jgi:iron(III) transport system ATP-binding protein